MYDNVETVLIGEMEKYFYVGKKTEREKISTKTFLFKVYRLFECHVHCVTTSLLIQEVSFVLKIMRSRHTHRPSAVQAYYTKGFLSHSTKLQSEYLRDYCTFFIMKL